jgi:hypothetical protein
MNRTYQRHPLLLLRQPLMAACILWSAVEPSTKLVRCLRAFGGSIRGAVFPPFLEGFSTVVNDFGRPDQGGGGLFLGRPRLGFTLSSVKKASSVLDILKRGGARGVVVAVEMTLVCLFV